MGPPTLLSSWCCVNLGQCRPTPIGDPTAGTAVMFSQKLGSWTQEAVPGSHGHGLLRRKQETLEGGVPASLNYFLKNAKQEAILAIYSYLDGNRSAFAQL